MMWLYASLGVSEERRGELKEPASANARMTETAQAAGISVAPFCSKVNGVGIEDNAIFRFCEALKKETEACFLPPRN